MEPGYIEDCLSLSNSFKQLESRNESVLLGNGMQNTVSANRFQIYTPGKQTLGIFYL